ncbi:type II secretion system inner membrane protein GspF [Bdellovibrionota bacterium FG-1]
MAPIYDYKAFTADGKATKGVVEAENQKAARQRLKKQGLMVSDIREKSTSKPSAGTQIPFFSGRVSGREVAMMTRQLASLVKSNIPLVEALSAMVDQIENDRLKVTLSQIRQDVNEGLSLGKATAKHPKIFDNISVNMIEAGESSGALGLVLLRLADLKEAQMRLRSKIVSASTYPVLMMIVSSLLMLGIFTFVIPKISKIFEGMNKSMPPLTAALIWISNIFVSGWYVFIGLGLAIVWVFRSYTNSPKGRPKWDAFTLKAPVVGPLIRMIAITRFANTMATLLGSGVPILTAMNIAKNLVDNAPIANAIANARENITEGQSIAEPLKRSGEFPPMMIHMISIGEKTGELPEMLKNVAETYEEQVNTQVEAMTSLLEPLMIVAMGLAIGVIVMAVFMPLMDMSDISKH